MFRARVGSAEVGSAAKGLVWLEEKKSTRPGVVEQVRNGGKGWKKNGSDNFSFFQEDTWRGKGRTGMGQR